MKDTINKLIEELKSKDGIKRQKARIELVEIGDEAIEPLRALLSSKEHHTRWEAIKTIEEIGSPNSIPLLIDYLEDDKFDIRWLAAEGLINIGQPSIKPLVSALIKDFESIYLREGAHHIFKYLEARGKYVDTSKIIPALESYNKYEVINAAGDLMNKL
ncbi:MAG TPA: HEAT repeat domain-containing protein [Bacteroidales bacterium]|nr:HEAT repeat domain-containing protein [Bacteroidales bacterium]